MTKPPEHDQTWLPKLPLQVAEIARKTLKKMVGKGLLPWPEAYEAEFWQVASEYGYEEVLRRQKSLLKTPVHMVEGFLDQTEEILDDMTGLVHTFATETRGHVDGIGVSIESIGQHFRQDSELDHEFNTIVTHNQALREQVSQTEKRLEEQAAVIQDLQAKLRMDPLTGVLNRRALDSDLAKEMARARRYQCPLSVAMADVDHFKHINDTYGHQMGDRVLQKLVEIIRHTIRESDSVYRYGGEEFLILLPHTTCQQGMVLAERLRNRVGRHIFTESEQGRHFGVRVSVGVGYVDIEDTASEVLQRVDRAMYKAKFSGRDTVTALCKAQEETTGH